MPVELTTPPVASKLRQRRHACRYHYVRKVNGARYQLRLYAGGGKRNGVSINLGLFETEWAAGQAMKRVVRLLRPPFDPVSVWEQLAPLRADGALPARVLPMFVKRVQGEPGQFVAKVRRGKVRAVLGPYDSPVSAGRAALAFVAAARAVEGR